MRRGTGIVVSPLIALMQDQVAALAQLGVRAAFLNSTLDADAARAHRARAARGRARPALRRARAPDHAALPRSAGPRADRTLRHRRGALRIAMGPRFPARVPAAVAAARALSARSAHRADGHRRPADARRDHRARLGLADARVFVSSFDRPNIRYTIVDKGDARAQLLRFIADEHPGEAGIVYCLSRRKVDETAAWLGPKGVRALPYHAGHGHAGARPSTRRAFSARTAW